MNVLGGIECVESRVGSENSKKFKNKHQKFKVSLGVETLKIGFTDSILTGDPTCASSKFRPARSHFRATAPKFKFEAENSSW